MPKFVDAITVTGGGVTGIHFDAPALADLAPLSTTSLLVGSSDSSTAAAEITLGTGLSMSGSTLNASGGGGGSGTVTSVGMTVPTGLAVSGSPITTSGTLAISWSGQIPNANGGTGIDTSAAANGKILIGTGSGLALANVTGSQGVSVTNGSGSIAVGLGAITPSTVNGVTLSGSSTPALAVTGTSTVSGTNTGDQTSVTGNAGTATALATARTINGVSFDGTANITVAAAAGTLTGSTLASGVTASSLTSFGASPALGGTPTAPTASGGTNTTQIATTAFVSSAVSTAVTGLLNFKGATDCSASPNYPSAAKGDAYIVSVAGKIGGSSGTAVDVGDWYVATANNAGGAEASVGSSWGHMEHNLVGALLASNNLSDLGSASTARTNLGLGTLATQSGTFSGTSSGTNTGDQTIPTALPPNGSAGGDLAGTYPSPTLKSTGAAGTYGDSTHYPIVTTDAQGRVTSVTTQAVTTKAYAPISGLQLSYATTAPTIGVSAGYCPDSTNSVMMVLSSPATITPGTSGGAGGADTVALAGTGAVTSGGAAVTGTGTAFLTAFGTRALSGTISSSGGTVTGSNTAFLSQVAVNDLIGTAALGYFRVAAIGSDSTLTLGSTPGTAFSGQAPNCVEQPTVKVGSLAAARVAAIASSTALTASANFSSTVSGQSMIAGLASGNIGDGVTNFFLHAFLVTSGGTTSATISTQRTTPLGSYTAFKRLGALPFDISAVLINFSQSGGNRRETHIQTTAASNLTRCLAAGSATSFTAVSLRNAMPPTSTLALCKTLLSVVSTGYNAFFRASNLATTVTGWYIATAATGTSTYAVVYLDTDGAQSIDYENGTASQPTTYLDVLGYVEVLP